MPKGVYVRTKEHIEKLRKVNTKHGMSLSKEYKTWGAIRERCLFKKATGYEHYGGRGITICERWKNSFENFYADMGKRPEGMSIDRIDNSKGYYKENCRWATNKEQANNMSTNRLITYKNETKTLAQWVDIKGISRDGIKSRIKKGLPLD